MVRLCMYYLFPVRYIVSIQHVLYTIKSLKTRQFLYASEYILFLTRAANRQHFVNRKAAPLLIGAKGPLKGLTGLYRAPFRSGEVLG